MLAVTKMRRRVKNETQSSKAAKTHAVLPSAAL
jgi:hypothetical protein